MKNTRTKQFFWTQLLTTALLGIALGLLLILLPVDLLLKIVFIIIGVITILSAIPSLVLGLSTFREKSGKLALISAVLSILMGILLIFDLGTVLTIVIGVYFLVFPIVEIVLAKDRMRQFKSELPKLIIGVVLLVLSPAGALDILFDIVGWIVLGLTALSVAFSIVTFVRSKKGLSTPTGARVFVDHDGDGTIDAVYVEATEKTSSDRESK